MSRNQRETSKDLSKVQEELLEPISKDFYSTQDQYFPKIKEFKSLKKIPKRETKTARQGEKKPFSTEQKVQLKLQQMNENMFSFKDQISVFQEEHSRQAKTAHRSNFSVDVPASSVYESTQQGTKRSFINNALKRITDTPSSFFVTRKQAHSPFQTLKKELLNTTLHTTFAKIRNDKIT